MNMAPQELERSASKYASEAIKYDSQGGRGMAVNICTKSSEIIYTSLNFCPKLNKIMMQSPNYANLKMMMEI